MTTATATHELQLGDILYSRVPNHVRPFFRSCYTSVDFYEVTKVVSSKTVELRKIGKSYVEKGSDYVVPVQGEYEGEPLRKRPKNGWVKLTKYSNAYKWCGEPQRQTA
jgi:hypothetical protein